MAILKYNGPNDVREVWGVSFPRGQRVETDDPDLIRKALCLAGFERVDAEPALDPAPDDYPAAPESEAFEELKIPVVGAGTIPENWREMHWKQRVKLAKDLSGMDDIATTEAADATIEALLASR